MFLPAPYGRAHTIRFPIVKRGVVDLAVAADWTPAAVDCKLSKDGGNVAQATNTIAAVGGSGSALWSLALTAAELTADEVAIQIVDAATKAVEDQALIIRTMAPPMYDAFYGRTVNHVIAPQVVGEPAGTAFDSDSTTHNVPIPTCMAGDLLIVQLAIDGNPTITTPTNWSLIFSDLNGTAVRVAAYAKIATAADGGTNVDFVTSAAEQGVALVTRIRAGTFSPDLANLWTYSVGTAATGTSTTPDPPSVTPNHGTANALVIAMYGADDQAQATAYPAGYEGGRTIQGANVAGASLGSARKIVATTAENPGSFTCASQEWVAQTISIHPAILGDVAQWRGTVPNVLISGRVDSRVESILAGLIAASHFANMTQPSQSAPPAATDPITAIAWMYLHGFRNKMTINQDGTVSMYDDAGTTVVSKFVVTDAAGLLTRPEIISGA